MAVGSMYRGKVTRTSTTGVWVTISSVYPGVEFGPCDIVATKVRIDDSPVIVGMADYIEAGDNVLVVETAPADFLIVGTIRNGVSTTGGL